MKLTPSTQAGSGIKIISKCAYPFQIFIYSESGVSHVPRRPKHTIHPANHRFNSCASSYPSFIRSFQEVSVMGCVLLCRGPRYTGEEEPGQSLESVYQEMCPLCYAVNFLSPPQLFPSALWFVCLWALDGAAAAPANILNRSITIIRWSTFKSLCKPFLHILLFGNVYVAFVAGEWLVPFYLQLFRNSLF